MQLPTDEVTQDDLYYLALFLKRLTHSEIRDKAKDDEECEIIKQALIKLEKELSREGIEPR